MLGFCRRDEDDIYRFPSLTTALALGAYTKKDLSQKQSDASLQFVWMAYNSNEFVSVEPRHPGL